MAPEICPNCGAEVPRNARACPECGSDERTGWSEEAAPNGLDLPEESFDYDDFVKKEFGQEGPVPKGMHPAWWIAALLLTGILIYFLVRW